MNHRLVILYGVGALSDVGRHAILAALERSNDVVEKVTVLTKHPDMLMDANWNCGCEEPHKYKENESKDKRVQIIPIQNWKKDGDKITQHMEDATAVISCLGNRNPTVGHWDSATGNQAVIDAITKRNSKSSDSTNNNRRLNNRVVALSSVGIEEDWPPMETFKPGQYILSFLFMSFGYGAFRDLTKMERLYKATTEKDIDYLFVRPVGIGEDVEPVNKWVLQKKKYDDTIGFNMAKLDVARYMVQEAINPTRHREAVIIGSEPETNGNASPFH